MSHYKMKRLLLKILAVIWGSASRSRPQMILTLRIMPLRSKRTQWQMKFLETLDDPSELSALHQKSTQLRKAIDERVQARPA